MFFHDAYVVRKEEIITATGEIGFSFIVAFPFLRAFPILSFNIFETLKELLSMNMSTRAWTPNIIWKKEKKRILLDENTSKKSVHGAPCGTWAPLAGVVLCVALHPSKFQNIDETCRITYQVWLLKFKKLLKVFFGYEHWKMHIYFLYFFKWNSLHCNVYCIGLTFHNRRQNKAP